MEIKIPASVKDMSLKHLAFLEWLVDLDEQKRSVLDIAPVELHECLALFTGIPRQQFAKFLLKSNYQLLEQILLSYNKRDENTKIPYELTYGDNTYVFQQDFTKLPTRWHIDTSEADVQKNPVDMMSFCYVEKGMVYGQAGDHNVILNPRSVRNKVFEENVDLELFLAVRDFFLESWSVLKILPEVRKRNDLLEKRRKLATRGSGKNQLTMLQNSLS